MRGALVPGLLVALTVAALLAPGWAVTAQAQDASPAASPAAGCPTTTEAENEAIARRWYDDIWNPQDATAIDALVSPNLVHHWAIGPDTEGEAAFAERVQATWAAFPVQYTVEFAVTNGDLVVLRWIGHGTHAGEFAGIAPTGNPVTFEGINIFRIECGKIAEVWSELDGIGLLGQMGVLPAAATPAATPAP